MQPQVPLKKYVLTFIGLYTLTSFLLLIFTIMLNIDAGTGMAIAPLLASALATINQFINNEKRLPSSVEKHDLTWFCILSYIGITSIYLLLIVGFSSGEGSWQELLGMLGWFRSLVIMFIGTAISMGFAYVVLSVSFGWYAKKAFASKVKREFQ